MKLFIDAMGGDHAPDCVLAGLELFAPEAKAELILLGDEAVLRPKLARLKVSRPQLIHCPDTIGMGESPVQAVRSKQDSSIVQGLKLAASTPDSAFFSAGHSGAVFAAALMAMGRIKGVERPAIATAIPTASGRCILLDAGANVDCRPNHLVDFAYMGSTYARTYLKLERPAVAILSNGEEESKGTELTRAAHDALKSDSRLNYIGYIEGKEITSGKASVIVTDGFTGNIVLKSLEGLGTMILSMIRRELRRTMLSRVGALFLMPGLTQLKKRFDYAETGSAPLLGVDGNCFIGHGRSGPRAIKNGILRAQEAIELQLHEALVAQFSQLRENQKGV